MGKFNNVNNVIVLVHTPNASKKKQPYIFFHIYTLFI